MSARKRSGSTGRRRRHRLSSAALSIVFPLTGRNSATGRPERVTKSRSPAATRSRTSAPLFLKSRTVTVSMKASVSRVRHCLPRSAIPAPTSPWRHSQFAQQSRLVVQFPRSSRIHSTISSAVSRVPVALRRARARSRISLFDGLAIAADVSRTSVCGSIFLDRRRVTKGLYAPKIDRCQAAVRVAPERAATVAAPSS